MIFAKAVDNLLGSLKSLSNIISIVKSHYPKLKLMNF